MKEHSNDRDKAEQSAHQRKNRGKGRAKKVWGVIGTIVLVGVLTMAIFVGIFIYSSCWLLKTNMPSALEMEAPI